MINLKIRLLKDNGESAYVSVQGTRFYEAHYWVDEDVVRQMNQKSCDCEEYTQAIELVHMSLQNFKKEGFYEEEE